MTLSEELRNKLKGVTLDLSPLQSYKDQKLWQEQAKKKIDFLRSVHPPSVTPIYEVAYIHGYVEGRVEALEEKRLKKTPGKMIEIVLTDGRVYHISKHLVADNRAKHYAENDPHTSYQEEYDYTMGETYEATDWLFNQMDWYDLNPILVEDRRPALKDAEVDDYNCVTVDGQPCLPGVLIDEYPCEKL